MSEEVRANSPVNPGDIVGGRYRVERVIGAGGMGVVHRNLDPDVQAAQVRQVKKFESGMVVNPVTIGPDATLADALARLIAAKIPLDGASDHGVSEALYLRDPDQNGVELYWDRPEAQWPKNPDGSLHMFTRRLDVDGLMKELER